MASTRASCGSVTKFNIEASGDMDGSRIISDHCLPLDRACLFHNGAVEDFTISTARSIGSNNLVCMGGHTYSVPMAFSAKIPRAQVQ